VSDILIWFGIWAGSREQDLIEISFSQKVGIERRGRVVNNPDTYFGPESGYSN
jgi:hypothetical protein